ncbi:MAG: serine hydrolase domain-containing protein [Caulobacterales bacterium]
MADATIEAVLRQGVESGVAPGLVAAWTGPGGASGQAAMGAIGVEDPAPMQADTLFWIASMTKAITTAAALQLVERGVLALDEPVADRLPELAEPMVLTGFDAGGRPVTRPARAPITLRRLLDHTSGLGYEFFNADLARHRAAAGPQGYSSGAPDTPLAFEPGEGWQYGIGIDWAGNLIERVTGVGLADYLADQLFEPLGMADTTFFPDPGQTARKAAMHARLPDGGLAPSAFAMPAEPYFSMGGGGLYSTAPDYLKFLSMILAGGEAGGSRLLSRQSLAAMTTGTVSGKHVGVLRTSNAAMSSDFDPFPGMNKSWGVGFVMNDDAGPAGRSAGSLAWAGLSNCYYWADPKRGVAGVLLAQVLPFADPRVLQVFADFERAVYQGADGA